MDVSSWSEVMNRTASSDEPGVDMPHLTLQTVIGISVAVAGNVLISLALNLQKLAHLRLAKERTQARMERELHVSGDRIYSRSLHDRTPSEDPAATHEPEAQPLIQDSSTTGSRTHYGASASVETRRDDSRSRKSTSSTRVRKSGKPQRKPNFASRFLPFRISLHGGAKDGHENVSHQEVSAIPVHVIPAEHLVTLDGNRRQKCPSPEVLEDEGTESDYLRSKLWLVFLFRSYQR